MTPQNFIQLMLSAAQTNQVQFKIPASVCIAQAALETGWGKSVIGNNYFGIKATVMNRQKVSSSTMEFINNVWVATTANFAQYTSLNQCVFEYGTFLQQPQYKPCFSASDSFAFCSQLQDCGYATDPMYAQKLIGIITSFNLTKYDITP